MVKHFEEEKYKQNTHLKKKWKKKEWLKTEERENHSAVKLDGESERDSWQSA